MSWDKYNEERKKARNSLDKAEKTVSKVKKSGAKDLTKSDVAQAKTAYKNGKKYKVLSILFAIIAIAALCTLPFADFFESKINNTIEKDGIKVAANIAFDSSELSINYVDVEQGDCILINLPDGKNMIIDSGSSMKYKNNEIRDNVFEYIDNKLLTGTGDSGKIDYMILTHTDYDHFSYMKALLERYEVTIMYRPYTYFGYVPAAGDSDAEKAEKQAFEAKEKALCAENGAEFVTKEIYQNTLNADKSKKYNGYNVKTESNAALYDALVAMYAEEATNGGDSKVKFHETAGTKITCGTGDSAYTFTFYAPISTTELYTDWNNYSCMLVLEYAGLKYCFTGDTEAELEAQIVQKYGDTLPDVDIMDAGHHGSKTSSSMPFLEKLKPEVAIFSCDDGTEFGHPTQDAIKRFLAVGVPRNCLFTTHLNGNICVGLKYTDTTAEAGSEVTDYIVGISKDGEVEITELKWWHCVLGIIVFAGVILLIIIPQIIKSVKKSKK